MASERSVDGVSLAAIAGDDALLTKYARYYGRSEAKLFARDFSKAVLGLRGLAEAAPHHVCVAPVLPNALALVLVPRPPGAPAAAAPVSGVELLNSLSYASPPLADEWSSILTEVWDVYEAQWLTLRRRAVLALRWALLYGPLVLGAITCWFWACAFLICVAMPELPVRFIGAMLRLIPRYLEYAGERVADSILAELRAALVDSATYGTAVVQRASHRMVNDTLTAAGGAGLQEGNPVVLVATWLLGAMVLKWLL